MKTETYKKALQATFAISPNFKSWFSGFDGNETILKEKIAEAEVKAKTAVAAEDAAVSHLHSEVAVKTGEYSRLSPAATLESIASYSDAMAEKLKNTPENAELMTSACKAEMEWAMLISILTAESDAVVSERSARQVLTYKEELDDILPPMADSSSGRW